MLSYATVVFESTPTYPNCSRYWDIIHNYDVTQFYVVPTALRLLKRAGDEYIYHKMYSLRMLRSVGEPIAAEVWKWYFEAVGKEEAHFCDVRFSLPLDFWNTSNFWLGRYIGKPRLA